MINVVPDPTVVITPALSIVATVASLDTHGVVADGVPDPIKVTELPRHTEPGPLIVGTLLTVITCVVVQPLLFVYVISVVPLATPVTIPPLSIVAIPGLLDTHGVVADGVPDPVNGSVLPT